MRAPFVRKTSPRKLPELPVKKNQLKQPSRVAQLATETAEVISRGATARDRLIDTHLARFHEGLRQLEQAPEILKGLAVKPNGPTEGFENFGWLTLNRPIGVRESDGNTSFIRLLSVKHDNGKLNLVGSRDGRSDNIWSITEGKIKIQAETAQVHELQQSLSTLLNGISSRASPTDWLNKSKKGGRAAEGIGIAAKRAVSWVKGATPEQASIRKNLVEFEKGLTGINEALTKLPIRGAMKGGPPQVVVPANTVFMVNEQGIGYPVHELMLVPDQAGQLLVMASDATRAWRQPLGSVFKIDVAKTKPDVLEAAHAALLEQAKSKIKTGKL